MRYQDSRRLQAIDTLLSIDRRTAETANPRNYVNGQVFLDGNDVYSATSVKVGTGPRTYSWPVPLAATASTLPATAPTPRDYSSKIGLIPRRALIVYQRKSKTIRGGAGAARSASQTAAIPGRRRSPRRRSRMIPRASPTRRLNPTMPTNRALLASRFEFNQIIQNASGSRQGAGRPRGSTSVNHTHTRAIPAPKPANTPVSSSGT